MSPLAAHIAGIPVEETLLYSVPILSTAGLACLLKIGGLARNLRLRATLRTRPQAVGSGRPDPRKP